MENICECNPKNVFYFFEQICQIPHGSGNVDRLSDYLVDFAKERNLFYIQDELKNVIITKEATEGYEDVEPIILQGHMDMVAVKKPGAAIDMEQEGLRLKIDGDYLYAEDTSLGGDDGIAVAYALAILDSNEIPHPKLEIIITVDEEVGMDGAREIDVSMLEGKRMLNIDSEEEGILLAGCAGGGRVDWKLPITWEQRQGSIYNIEVKGLLGGHSGNEIDKQRGNANKLMGRILTEVCAIDGFSIAKLEGGLADNAIPRDCLAQIIISDNGKVEFLRLIQEIGEDIKRELQTKDPELFIEVMKQKEDNCECISQNDVKKVCYMLFCAPNGVESMSADIEGLVETSLNMGIINLTKEGFFVQFSVRSSLESAKKELIKRLEMLIDTVGGKQEVRGVYPGWTYLKDSPFRDLCIDVFRKMYEREPEIQAIHAGLECGLLSAKIPGLECISIGPDMRDIHTTEECLSISSTERVWNYVLEILKQK